MHAQVLIHPEGVQRLGIESGEEHVHHNQQIHLTVFHPHREVFVIVLELL